MLEIKNLTKIYKTKGGADVKALDNVSVAFEKTGLVFLLGKSGSGKSTLLNLIGGLDSPTDGEVIVLGKSSKDFSGSDFDSYRNTYVGFIFQEYNILNEFNVEDNVALALELQGKRKDPRLVTQILQQVELGNFAKRKPNTLSGGQKQRIAIARALVKDPQIIMADEPTGALDSATGKQVFETLKRLSCSRLVLVVSHDREFAMRYGDRIIELSDGKIISDVSKTKEDAVKVSDSIIKSGNNTITIKSGADLNDTLISSIKDILDKSEGDVIISGGKDEVANFKAVNRIDDEGARERFSPTEEVSVERDRTAQFIKSRLPLSKAIKIGASSLRLKPFRLAFTILLTFISFMMFGLFSTLMLYNGDSVMEKSFVASDYTYITLNKQYEARISSENFNPVTSYMNAKFTPGELNSYPENSFGGYKVNATPSNIVVSSENSQYYLPEIINVAVLPSSHPLRSLITGSYPDENGFVISSYLADCIVNYTYYSVDEAGNYGNRLELKSANELIGKSLMLFNTPIKITGIFDSGDIPEKYDSLKKTSNESDYLNYMFYSMYIKEGLHSLAFVSEDIKEFMISQNSDFTEQYFDYVEEYLELSYNSEFIYAGSAVKVYPAVDMPTITLFKNQTELNDNQLIIPIDSIINYVYVINEKGAIDKNIIDTLLKNLTILSRETILDEQLGEIRKATNEEKEEATTEIIAYFAENPIVLSLTANDLPRGQFEIVGFYTNATSIGYYCAQSFYDSMTFFTSKLTTETKYKPEADATYDAIFASFNGEKESLNNILSDVEYTDPQTDIFYSVNNVLYYQVTLANDIVDALSQVFLWVGIVLAVFASLLLFNFISMSITNKKKEIGILRAVGARGLDVFKIFFAESLIIVGLCLLLSILGTFGLTGTLNSVLKTAVGLEVTIFVFGLLSIFIMLCVALFVAAISTFLPVFFTSRKKPVESIRAL